MDYSQFIQMPQELGLLVVFLLVFIYDVFMPQRSQRALPVFTTVLFAIYTALCFVPCCACSCLTSCGGSLFGGMIECNGTTWAMKNILNVGMLLVLLQAGKWSNSEYVSVRRGEFYELLLLTLFGMFLMISGRHFLIFVIGLETASLPIAALAAFEKNRYESREAAAKYVFTAIFSSAIFLLGISFVYGIAGTLYFDGIAKEVINNHSALLIVAIAFVISGVAFKLSLVPFHQWTADVYQGAPTAVTSYLSVISKGAAAYSFLIILVQVFGSAYAEVWEWMLYAIIILTITIGNLFAMRQRNLKRFLAYSSISQAGYIMLGVIAVNTLGMASMMYYVLVYVFSNLAAFGVIAAIERQTGKVTTDDYNGLFKTNPWLAFTMMLAMFSLGGIPPFAGFFSKFFIFVGACKQGSVAIYVLVFIALVNTIISLYYYLLVVKAMFIRQDECAVPAIKSSCGERTSMILCALGIILIGLASCIYMGLEELTSSVSVMFALV
ncbi:MAG: NADH-quinone oxidoreductase subunit N [Bacteroidales bacterium]|nr:NADH-quinone oxidoreductase subunit N [Candidatus Sodaliphilus limicaballi]